MGCDRSGNVFFSVSHYLIAADAKQTRRGISAGAYFVVLREWNYAPSLRNDDDL